MTSIRNVTDSAFTPPILSSSTRIITSMKELKDLYPENFYPNAQDVELPTGLTRYYRFGKENGDKIVMVHGITIPSPVFKRMVDLLSKDFNILLYDLVGRGYSETSNLPHDDRLYVLQLSALLHKLGEQSKFHLIGLSLGGAIAVSYASQFPEKIKSLSLFAPAGLMGAVPFPGRIFSLPYFGEGMYSVGAAQFIMKKNAEGNFCMMPENEHFSSMRQKMLSKNFELSVLEDNARILELTHIMIDTQPSFRQTFLDTIRSFPLTYDSHIRSKYEKVGTLDFPVFVVWVRLSLRCFIGFDHAISF